MCQMPEITGFSFVDENMSQNQVIKSTINEGGMQVCKLCGGEDYHIEMEDTPFTTLEETGAFLDECIAEFNKIIGQNSVPR
jgi:hypothetical protein